MFLIVLSNSLTIIVIGLKLPLYSILAKDISEYKNAEKRLSEQSVMLANINDAVIGTDVNYHINYWSKSV